MAHSRADLAARTSRVLALVAAVVLLAACGGDSSGSESVAIVGGDANEAAYQEAYAAAWVKSCKAAVAKIRKDAASAAARVHCARPVAQMEGNTSFDPEQSKVEGRRQGTFDGCAYAWDEAYAASGEVEARC
ncbi:MAG: hypothetical protein ACRDMK_00380 [Gaiellaceae bacterium]